MKKILALFISAWFLLSAFGSVSDSSQTKQEEKKHGKNRVQLYVGIRGGAGLMLSRDQLKNLGTNNGFVDASKGNSGWSVLVKGEALFGFRRLRIGYQFIYNFSQSGKSSLSYEPIIDNGRNTTYFNNSKTNIFAHYILVEIAVVNRPHFALVPGIALGTFGGYKVDNTTGKRVWFSENTHNRISAGAELNFEIKFGRCVFFLSPNYYLFHLQDKGNSNWREFNHFLGADVGFRFNLIKP